MEKEIELDLPRIIGKLLLFILLIYWTFKIFRLPPAGDPQPWILVDYVNLLFHEAGHYIIFAWFGQTIFVLGGTLGQLLWPAVTLVVFLAHKERCSAAFSLFWLGENFTNIGQYMADARALALPLLTSDTEGHDWHYLLSHWNILSWDIFLGRTVFIIGIIIVILAIAWMTRDIYEEFGF